MSDTRQDQVPRYDVRHPEYEHWLRETRVRETASDRLLVMLASRDLREQEFHRWHSERCNPLVPYTSASDMLIIAEAASVLGLRIDSGGHRR
jgi:hypothetical protein